MFLKKKAPAARGAVPNLALELPQSTQRFLDDYESERHNRRRNAKILAKVIAHSDPADLVFPEGQSSFPPGHREGLLELLEKASAEVPPIPHGTPETPINLLEKIDMFGPLAALVEDPDLSEIMVNSKDQVYLERNGKLEETGLKFSRNEDILQIMTRVLAKMHRRIDEDFPMVDARLPDGSRLNCIIPPLSVQGPMMTVRKFQSELITHENLIQTGVMSPQMARFLKLAVESKRNIIICGGAGSGKTTLLNVLSTFIPEGERVITIEDAAELKLPHSHLGRLEARPKDFYGKGEVTIRDLFRNALRMRPDRILVGEVRGPEVMDMLQAMNSGHAGSMTTTHANSPRDLLARLEIMISLAGTALDVQSMRNHISTSIELVIEIRRFQDGSRKIANIVEITGMEGPTIIQSPLFRFQRTGTTDQGMVVGEFLSAGYYPKFFEDLVKQGYEIPKDLT